MPGHDAFSAAIAARDNAAWCASVCAAHGIGSDEAEGVWRADAPTPAGYPEAVTLEPGLDPEVVLAALPTGSTSVKDSFADVDLTAGGFRVQFEAQWIMLPASGPSAGAAGIDGPDLPVLTPIRTPGHLAEWAASHGGTAAFASALLDDPTVVILGERRGGAVVAGAILSVGENVIGMSNVFGAASVYPAAAADARRRRPGRPVVGWETDGDLAAPLAAGFHRIGPLRVWLR